MTSSFPENGSATRGDCVRRQAEALSDLGVEVRVVAPAYQPGSPAGERMGRLLVKRFPFRRPQRPFVDYGRAPILPSLSLLRGMGRAVAEACVEESVLPDIVHAHWLLPSGFASSRVLMRRELSAVPLVVTCHGSDLHSTLAHSPAGAWAARRALARTARVVIVSESLRPFLAHLSENAAAAADLIHMGTDLPANLPSREELRAGFGLSADTVAVLFAGRLAAVKGFDLLMSAWPRVAAAVGDAELVVAGDGPLRPLVDARVAAHDNVRFLGSVERRELMAWMRAADLVVVPSRQEGSPLVAEEALATGTPVLASRAGFARELLAQGGGWERSLATVEELAESMVWLLSDGAAREDARRAAVLPEAYRTTTAAANLAKLYDELLAPARSPATADS